MDYKDEQRITRTSRVTDMDSGIRITKLHRDTMYDIISDLLLLMPSVHPYHQYNSTAVDNMCLGDVRTIIWKSLIYLDRAVTIY